MLILLPPSEGKAVPRRGRPLDLELVGLPGPAPGAGRGARRLRRPLHDAEPTQAAAVLGLGPTQADEVTRNALLSERTHGEERTGSTPGSSTRRSTSAPSTLRRDGGRPVVWRSPRGLGLLRRPTTCRRTALRPGLASRASVRSPVTGRVTWPRRGGASGDGLVVDLRSSAYAPFCDRRSRRRAVVTMHVLHEIDGRTPASVTTSTRPPRAGSCRPPDRRTAPRHPGRLADLLADLGSKVETAKTARRTPGPARRRRRHPLDPGRAEPAQRVADRRRRRSRRLPVKPHDRAGTSVPRHHGHRRRADLGPEHRRQRHLERLLRGSLISVRCVGATTSRPGWSATSCSASGASVRPSP